MCALGGSAGDASTDQQHQATRTLAVLPPEVAGTSRSEIEVDMLSDEDVDLNPDARTPSRRRRLGRAREPAARGLTEASDHPLSGPKMRTADGEFTPSHGVLPAAALDPCPEIVCVHTPTEVRDILSLSDAEPTRYEPYTPLMKRILFSFCFLNLFLLLIIAVLGHFPPTDDYVRAIVDGKG
jgi:hypothetical protein